MKHQHHERHGHHQSGQVAADHKIQYEYPRKVKFCPLCGGGLELRIVAPDHKENKVCRKCGFIYFLGPKLVAGCIIADGDRTLLLRRGIEPARGKWTYPGGFVDLGETPERCAVRETHEEVGMTVRDPALLGIYADRDARGDRGPLFRDRRDSVGRSRVRHHHSGDGGVDQEHREGALISPATPRRVFRPVVLPPGVRNRARGSQRCRPPRRFCPPEWSRSAQSAAPSRSGTADCAGYR